MSNPFLTVGQVAADIIREAAEESARTGIPQHILQMMSCAFMGSHTAAVWLEEHADEVRAACAPKQEPA